MAEPQKDNMADALAAMANGQVSEPAEESVAEEAAPPAPAAPQPIPSLVPARPQRTVRPATLPSGYAIASAPKARPSMPGGAPVPTSNAAEPPVPPSVINPSPTIVRPMRGSTLAMSPGGIPTTPPATYPTAPVEGQLARPTTPPPPVPQPPVVRSPMPVAPRAAASVAPVAGAAPMLRPNPIAPRVAIPVAPTPARANQPPVSLPARPPQLAGESTEETPASTPKPKKLRKGFRKSLEFKRTLIPICLTFGLVLPAIAIAGYTGLLSQELGDVFHDDMKWAFWTLIFLGFCVLGLGVANMVQVVPMLKVLREYEVEQKQAMEAQQAL
jgi:hypothetical protein